MKPFDNKKTEKLLGHLFSQENGADADMKSLIQGYLESTQDEKATDEGIRGFFNRFLDRKPNRHSRYVAESLRRLQLELNFHTITPIFVSLTRRRSFRLAAIGLAAAAVIAAAILIPGLFPPSPRPAPAMMASAFKTVVAPHDRTLTVMLPDGTEVTLNHNATLSYNDRRETKLSGEAWFKVTKDAAHPFVIESGALKTTVLGTEFNFNTRTDAGESILSLYEGVVQLDHVSGTYRLDHAGREFVLDLTTGHVEVRDFDPNPRSTWQRVAKREQGASPQTISLDEAFDLIEGQYGVKVTGREAVDTSRKLHFMLSDDMTLDHIMHALQLAAGQFGYTIHENTITLEKN